MKLNPQPAYPSVRRYVLKLHRDAVPQHGQLCGRLEHITTGDRIDFANGVELLAGLAQHASAPEALPASTAGESNEASV